LAYLTNAKVKLPNGKTKDIHKVPDMPVATITYDKVEGRFTHNDGTVSTYRRTWNNVSTPVARIFHKTTSIHRDLHLLIQMIETDR
jgi:hypothetical protein